MEKAVDVMLAVDLGLMAERGGFDTSYLLSADGDFTPAVEAARSSGKKVFAVSASQGAKASGGLHCVRSARCLLVRGLLFLSGTTERVSHQAAP